MPSDLLTADEAARALGISVLTLYDWLKQSDRGRFAVRGQPFMISYFQGGRRGQGRIRIDVDEVKRLQEAMRVHPIVHHERRAPQRVEYFPGIKLPLGLPADRR